MTSPIEQKFQSALQNFQAGNLNKAEQLCQQMLLVEPDNADLIHFIGVIIAESGGKDDLAIRYITKAIQLNSTNAEFHKNLGMIFKKTGKHEEAIASLEKALSLQSDSVEVLLNLGLEFNESGKMDEAISSYRRAISLQPDYVEAHKNLALALKKSCRHDEAIASFRQALSLNPGFTNVHLNLLSLMNYCSSFSQEEILQETLVFVKNHINPVERINHYPHEGKTFERKLRVGYISPDFRKHSIFFFFEPLLKSHDRKKFDVYCYSDVKEPDVATLLIEEKADHWRPIAGKNDIDVIEDIKQDKIDILVELAGFTTNNRLAMMASKSVPIQVSWLGYPNTTGLPAIDYRFTDAIADPPDQDKFYSEELIRLKNGFLSYHPYTDTPDVSPPPCLENGIITFGSFNNLLKITPEVIDVWSEILLKVPDSRLFLKNLRLDYESVVKRYLKLFESKGVSSDRIDMVGKIPSRSGHLAAYNRIDITLDPFPYNGTTTTCEALWMGVPVITLVGNRHAGRVGASLMHSIGMEEPFVADSVDSYIKKAVSLARDQEQLVKLRKELRLRLKQSPLYDAASFAKKIEDAYQAMWEEYIKGHVKENSQA